MKSLLGEGNSINRFEPNDGIREVITMVIERIDAYLCDGCGICVNTCWIDVIRMDEKEKKAVIKYPEDCVVCTFCEQDCPQHAIYVSPTKEATPLTIWGVGI